ncbi:MULTISPECIES: thioesterase family protein [unclassified Pseudomonas]|uniref:thioesterase family protein n=1 Tax=unclassified Pseudomonas TaxID=196821 RepID=UPI000C885C31|nr:MULTISPECIES: thioesterase family protein [unclassified Pseudomonas]PNA02629.1 4-hydroxybenzoyl-CoA thioesterase [Pseudomonas sp. FW305-42]PNA26868.1 4-hydroxybenzoyl-CoA thioesterase [Pseudomonas sp. MPR-R1B]PNB27666.1 4-hydroxybenzoyl-CoA thioesterase [Pseudomonas sp. DP16D-E2]PNB44194.1 4-hydroxybenzoyl-CoA thioesterase [Pseudomonas sp. FW305-17]PNB63182.1 4-hydroxybenzoyl-CoA thioesterase [Pseudomonas sp. GW531-E2]
MPALITYRTRVLPEWVDYNGHLRDAYYLLIFSYATDSLMERIGLDADARGQSGHSLFTLEAHINYLHEVKLDSEVWVQTYIIGFDKKRLHLYHSLHRRNFEEALCASEQMLLHVDMVGPKSASFGAKSIEQLENLVNRQDSQPRSLYVGRTIRIR